jgi:hypothetical protein
MSLNLAVLQSLYSCNQDVRIHTGVGAVVNALSKRVKAYLPQICETIGWHLYEPAFRQQGADLISRIAVVMETCQEVSQRSFCTLLHELGNKVNV